MSDLEFLSDERIEPRDKETMSLSACLNRIRIKVEQDNYTDTTVDELKADFEYVAVEKTITREQMSEMAI